MSCTLSAYPRLKKSSLPSSPWGFRAVRLYWDKRKLAPPQRCGFQLSQLLASPFIHTILFTPGQTLISFPMVALSLLSHSPQIVHPTAVSVSRDRNVCRPGTAEEMRFSAPHSLASNRIHVTFPRPAVLLGPSSHPLLLLPGPSSINHPLSLILGSFPFLSFTTQT